MIYKLGSVFQIRYKFKCIWSDNRNKWIKTLAEHILMIVNVNLIVKDLYLNTDQLIIQEKHCVCKEGYVLNPSACGCEINRYLKSIDGLIITCNKMIDLSDTLSIILYNKKVICKIDKYYILLTFLLVTILLLIIVIICYYCIKYCPKQKDILPY